jgi:hypothetical protein
MDERTKWMSGRSFLPKNVRYDNHDRTKCDQGFFWLQSGGGINFNWCFLGGNHSHLPRKGVLKIENKLIWFFSFPL